jgi:hypothetical protein
VTEPTNADLARIFADHAKDDRDAIGLVLQQQDELREMAERNYEAHLETSAKLDKVIASTASMVAVWGTGSSLAAFVKIMAPFLGAVAIIGAAVAWVWGKFRGLFP